MTRALAALEELCGLNTAADGKLKRSSLNIAESWD
jgi:hypothetical protein